MLLSHFQASSSHQSVLLSQPLTGLPGLHWGKSHATNNHHPGLPPRPEQPNVLFLSDTSIPVHPRYQQAMIQAMNTLQAAYGNDVYMQRLSDQIKALCGPHSETFLVPSGTGAYAFAAQMAGSPDRVRVLMTEQEHAGTWGANAVKHYKQKIASADGLLTADQLTRAINQEKMKPPIVPRAGIVLLGITAPFHQHLPLEELKKITQVAHDHRTLVIVDAARGFNNDYGLKEMSQAGVDIICWGGTKQGLYNAEMVVFTDHYFENYPKTIMTTDQPGQLDRKRFRQDALTQLKSNGMLQTKWGAIANQFLSALETDHAYQVAQHSNAMAQSLAQQIKQESLYELVEPVSGNGVFVKMPVADAQLLSHYYQYLQRPLQEPGMTAARLMVSPEVKPDDMQQLVTVLQAIKQESAHAGKWLA